MAGEVLSKPRKERVRIPSDADFLESLVRADIFTKEVIAGTEYVVVDLDRFRESVHALFGEGSGRSDEDTRRLLELLVNVVKNPVLSRRQVELGGLNPKPLFYVPKDAKSATSTIQVKIAQFHLLLSDFLVKLRLRTEHPLLTVSEDQISCLEASTAVVLLHPDYGDGFRDEEGILYLRDRKTREYNRFSGSILDPYGIHKGYFLFTGGMKEGRAADRSLREGFEAELPSLVGRGILDPRRDVRQITSGSDGIEERSFEHKGVSSDGSRSINGVRHYIGKKFHNLQQPVLVTTLSKTLGCVIDESRGYPRIVSIFNIVNKDGASQQKNGSNVIHAAGASLTNPRDFSAEAIGIKKRQGETTEAYEIRCEAVDRGLAYLLLESAKEYPEVAAMLKIDDFTTLASFGKVAYWLDSNNEKERFDDFISNFGLIGLKSFLATAYDSKASEYIFTIARVYEKSEAQAVFAKFAEFADAAQLAESIVSEGFNNEEQESLRQTVEQTLLVRATNLLKRAASKEMQVLSKEERTYELARSLDILVAEATQCAAFGKELRKRGRGERAKEVFSIHQKEFSARELTTLNGVAIHNQMMNLAEDNYADVVGRPYQYPNEFKRVIAASFEDLPKKKNAKIFTQVREEKDESGRVTGERLLAALRIDDNTKDAKRLHLYFGSFVADFSYAGGGFGEELLVHTFSQVEKEYAGVQVVAHCDPRAPITMRYIEMGFVAEEVIDFAGVSAFTIVLDRNSHARLGAKKFSQEDVVSRAGEQEGEHEDGGVLYIVSGAPISPATFAEKIKEKKVLTRYFKQDERHYAVFESM